MKQQLTLDGGAVPIPDEVEPAPDLPQLELGDFALEHLVITETGMGAIQTTLDAVSTARKQVPDE